MTIEAASRAAKWSALAAAALAAWTALVATLGLFAPVGSAVAVIGPRQAALAAAIAAGGRLVETGPFGVVARFDAPGFVRRLYANGALLVVDAESGGCRGGRRKPADAMRL